MVLVWEPQDCSPHMSEVGKVDWGGKEGRRDSKVQVLRQRLLPLSDLLVAGGVGGGGARPTGGSGPCPVNGSSAQKPNCDGGSLCFFLCRMSGEHTSAVSICEYCMSLKA